MTAFWDSRAVLDSHLSSLVRLAPWVLSVSVVLTTSFGRDRRVVCCSLLPCCLVSHVRVEWSRYHLAPRRLRRTRDSVAFLYGWLFRCTWWGSSLDWLARISAVRNIVGRIRTIREWETLSQRAELWSLSYHPVVMYIFCTRSCWKYRFETDAAAIKLLQIRGLTERGFRKPSQSGKI